MALRIYGTFEPDGTFPAVKAEDVEMPDGKRLSEVELGGGEGGGSSSAESPISVDLSAYETQGLIVETYADGSEITYQMEFDSEGRPIKVTDSNGNETVLTW